MFNQTIARQTSIATLRLHDGTTVHGAVGGTQRDTFSLTSHNPDPDAVLPINTRYRYEDVAEVIDATPRTYVPLATFSRLMKGMS